jgi:hypothetical protein
MMPKLFLHKGYPVCIMLCKRCASDSRYWSCSRLYSGNNQLYPGFFAIESIALKYYCISNSFLLPKNTYRIHEQTDWHSTPVTTIDVPFMIDHLRNCYWLPIIEVCVFIKVLLWDFASRKERARGKTISYSWGSCYVYANATILEKHHYRQSQLWMEYVYYQASIRTPLWCNQ